MATRKPESRPALRREPVRFDETASNKKDAEVLHARLQPADELLVIDDDGFGGDPYNSTGRFSQIKDRAEDQ